MVFVNLFWKFLASVFGEQHKLAPMPEDRKRRWRREVGWLLSVTDYIVEFVASQQAGKDGSNMEVIKHAMEWNPRFQFHRNPQTNPNLIICNV